MRIIPAAALLCLSAATLSANILGYINSSGFTVPDNDPAGGAQSIVVGAADAGSITSVSVWFTGTHNWSGDLIMRISNGTQTADLINRPGLGPGRPAGFDSNLNGTYYFVDGGYHFWTAANLGTSSIIPNRSYQPSTTGGAAVAIDSLFAGQNRAGTWTLSISDNGWLDTLAISQWGLEISATPYASPVPEPATLGLTGLGLLAAALVARRRR